ncbi:MAG: PIN domain-containing protein [Myxococcota bacterium]|nr:PIN domain-containing protein [Myxococcota bacterium]
MPIAFVDTAYFVALLDPRDRLHQRALDVAKELAARKARLVTSDAVLFELGNYFARSPLRAQAIEWIFALRAAPGWTIATITPALVVRAEALYRAHTDKTWSVTDCSSMEIMRDLQIRDVATTDHGFAQAGFRLLLARA